MDFAKQPLSIQGNESNRNDFPSTDQEIIFSRDTKVDHYWNEHTVSTKNFETPEDSLSFLEWRFNQYPQFRQMMGLYGDHSGETILDYGCGPGNDLIGFGVYSKAQKIIGIDISEKALRAAWSRIKLHNLESRVNLVKVSDMNPLIPLATSSIDYIYCEGVLHHTSSPVEILKEFYRLMKPGKSCSIMVYNKNSVWYHLYTAYVKMIIENRYSGMTTDQAFAKTTDGDSCPISVCYSPDEFVSICNESGFDAEFVGGYLSLHELDIMRSYFDQAIRDVRLADVHKIFLGNLNFDEQGLPRFDGQYAGIGGVYNLFRQR